MCLYIKRVNYTGVKAICKAHVRTFITWGGLEPVDFGFYGAILKMVLGFLEGNLSSIKPISAFVEEQPKLEIANIGSKLCIPSKTVRQRAEALLNVSWKSSFRHSTQAVFGRVLVKLDQRQLKTPPI